MTAPKTKRPTCTCGPVPEGDATHSVEATPEIAGYVTVTCDGTDVTNEAAALRAGPDGWVCLFRRDDTGCRYTCPVTGPLFVDEGDEDLELHVAVEYRTGDVAIFLTAPEQLPLGHLTHFAALGIELPAELLEA